MNFNQASRWSFRAALPAIVLFLLAFPAIAADRPNIVLVFIDDMGWGDFSCFGNHAAQTPQIDRLAQEGIRFEQFYHSVLQEMDRQLGELFDFIRNGQSF